MAAYRPRWHIRNPCPSAQRTDQDQGRPPMQCNMFPHSTEAHRDDSKWRTHLRSPTAFAQQYPNPQISKGLRQQVFMGREIDHQPLQSAVLFFQLAQPPQARSPPDARTSSSRRKAYPAMPSCRQRSCHVVLERFFISAEQQSRQK